MRPSDDLIERVAPHAGAWIAHTESAPENIRLELLNSTDITDRRPISRTDPSFLMTHRKERYVFRFIGIDSEVLKMLSECCNPAHLTIRHTDERGIVAVVDLTENVDYSWLIEISQHPQFVGIQKGLYVSLVTDSDSSGVSVPSWVSTIYLAVGGSLDFSFTVV